MAANILTHNLSEPLNGATTAKIDIDSGTGNLTIDRLDGGEQLMASGELQYFEKQDAPTHSVVSTNGQARFTLKSGRDTGRRWLRLPWSACNGATDWQIHINPTVASDIVAHSDGGNIKINLTGMSVSHLAADTGGGNMDVILPEDAANLSVTARTGAGNVNVAVGSGFTGRNIVEAKSGAGNVVVLVPGGIEARIRATSGLGKTILDPRFYQVDENTYQSPGYAEAKDKVEITVHSGAGNVNINTTFANHQ